LCGVLAVVQLHFEESRIKEVVERSRGELGEYWPFLVDFYDDLLSDASVSSASTRYNYVVKVRMFLRWLKGRGVMPEDIDERLVKAYVRELRSRLKPAALDPHFKALKRFLRLVGKGELASLIKYPRRRMPRYELPEPEVVERIIGEIEKLDYQVIVALLYETGARVSEVLSLRGRHVREAPEGYFRVFIEDAKNGEFRTVFVIKYAGLLRHYLTVRRPRPDDWLFPSPTRAGRPLHPRNVEILLRRLGRKHGVRIHPHLLRHLRGTLLIKEGVQERIVMKLLGHRTEKMMRIYVNLTARDVEEVLLRRYGIEVEKPKEAGKVKCPKCGAENPPGARYCWRCGYPLSQAGALQKEASKERLEELIGMLKKLLKERPELAAEILSGT